MSRSSRFAFIRVHSRFSLSAARGALVGLACLSLACGSSLAAEVALLQVADDHAALTWHGDAGPYQPQFSPDLHQWFDYDRPTELTAGTVSAFEEAAGYRVLALGEAGLGPYVGQLRIQQGEWGDIMARHRLKSLWDFHLPNGPFSPSTPADYMRGLIVRCQYLDGTRWLTLVGTLESFPGGSVRAEDKQLTFSWQLGEGKAQRGYSLVAAFPYDIGVPSRTTPLLSDPQYTLTCSYATPQIVIGWDNRVTTTSLDEAALSEIPATADEPFAWIRDRTVVRGRVSIRTGYSLGRPYYRGELPFIYKTPLLLDWLQPTMVSGLTTPSFSLASRFAQTYDPFHHNFVESFWLEPELDPGLDPAILDQLRQANIRMIIATDPSAFPEQEQQIRLVGFDGTVRDVAGSGPR